jgi:methylated-DNA-[protein]-cysteine S-methyltransferase
MTASITCIIASKDPSGTAVELSCSEQGITSALYCSRAGRRKAALSAEEAVRAFRQRHPWFRELVAALERYLAGETVDFTGFPLDLSDQPPFRRAVLEACHQIPYGRTVSYAELAAKAGNPKAVRAAGSAMSHNPISIIIPCHRVLRSDGGVGGFSAPEGVALKERLLAMERSAK